MKLIRSGCLTAALSLAAGISSWGLSVVEAQGQKKFKNVIMMIPDGCDDGVLGLARWYKNEPLAVDELALGSVQPYMANSVMTDSAPGGTAYSTGKLTTDKFIAVGPRREDLLSNLKEFELWDAYAPIPTVLEAAKDLGMATGLIATSTVTHATPADFAAHVDDRSKEQEIAKQMVFNGVDVVMGGGRRNMLPLDTCPADDSVFVVIERQEDPVSGSREDCLNLELELGNRGYDMCFTKQGLMALKARAGQKVWCSFASGHMQPDMDRQHFAETEPSISEMTDKAIEILSKNPAGFFLMVEGSQVDWAGHANDPIWMVTDFLAWDDAVRVALDFAKEDGETLVLALPDHNTGGLKVGNFKHEYVDRTVEFAREPLLKMKMTSNGVVTRMGVPPENATAALLKTSVTENWGINITDEEAETILGYSAEYSSKFLSNPGDVIPLEYALSRIVSEEYTIAGWTTHGHNAEDVPMWIYGMEPPKGFILNTDVGKLVGDVLGGMERLERDLYVDLATTNLEWTVDTTNVTNQYATVGGFTFPLNTDYFLNQGVRVSLPGITVYAPMTDKLYISSEAIAMVQSLM